MNALVTGGAGFLGHSLVGSLLAGPDRIERLTVLDTAPPSPPLDDPRVATVAGDVTDRSLLDELVESVDLVWHLAAVLSAGAEADFDLGLGVNLSGTMALLEALRATGRRPRLVFASSLAVYGGPLPGAVDDTFRLTPQTSYGTHKAVGELLVADYSRKGYLDGRCVRPPTVVVRPSPNLAASTFASSIVREPLAGRDVVCPVAPETRMVVISPQRVVEALLLAMDLPEDAWHEQRAVQLPGLTVSVGEIVEALARLAGEGVAGRVRFEPDPAVERIVAGWAQAVSAERALSLGFRPDGSVDEIVAAYAREAEAEQRARTSSTSGP